MLDLGVGGGRTTAHFAERARAVHRRGLLGRDGCRGTRALSPSPLQRGRRAEVHRVMPDGGCFAFSTHNLATAPQLLSWRPRVAVRTTLRQWKLRRMNPPLREIASRDWMVLQEGALQGGLQTYYVRGAMSSCANWSTPGSRTCACFSWTGRRRGPARPIPGSTTSACVSAVLARRARMRALLFVPLLLLALACRENPSPESQAVTTASETTASETTATETAVPETITADTVKVIAPPALAAPAVNGPKLMPVDEAISDRTLVAFRDKLVAAVRRRDVDAVIALSDPKIRTSFGDDGGAAELRRKLQDGALMKDLEQILPLGGTFKGLGNERTFWAPYVYSAWPDQHDAFESLAVIRQKVPLRKGPNSDAEVIAELAYDIVGQQKREGNWFQVKTADGRTGWVEKAFVVSPVGYRAGISKINGQWRMRALVAGD
jgi:hypothetical protein